MKRNGDKISKYLIILFGVLFLMMPVVSAGVGISWDKQSALVPEKTKTCLTYKVYNPWPKDTYAKVVLSDELQKIIASQDSETQFIPRDTSSSEAMPITFCFKTPSVYKKDCLIGNSLICKQDCNEEMKSFTGEVQIVELTEQEAMSGGYGGSRTSMSVSAPLTIRVQCVKHGRDYSVVYAAVALIAGLLLAWNILRKKKENKKSKKKSKKRK